VRRSNSDGELEGLDGAPEVTVIGAEWRKPRSPEASTGAAAVPDCR
jgi:hypothetical protein